MKLYESFWIPRSSYLASAGKLSSYFERPDDIWDDSKGTMICLAWLQNQWELPDDAVAIKIIAHNRPAQCRVAIAISKPDKSIDNWVHIRSVETSKQNWRLPVGELQYSAQKFAGKTVFVELWYR